MNTQKSERQMSDNEIRRDYAEAKFPKKQIKILAELNGCSQADIYKIIGVKKKDRKKSDYHRINWTPELDNAIISMLKDGKNQSEICRILGLNVRNRVYRLKIEGRLE